MNKYTNDQLSEYFGYLDELRESGVTNMFGAGAYLEREYAMSRKDAREVLTAWMDTFDRDLTIEARAEAALAKATSNP